MKNVLINLVHPDIDSSKVNKFWLILQVKNQM